MRSVHLLVLLALLLAGSVQAQPSSPELAEDERLLKATGVAVDGPGLLAFFRARTPGLDDRERAAALVQQLGSDRYAERQRASAGLAALGMRARPALRAALTDPDPEVRRRAQEGVATLEARDEEALAGAAARLLAARAPAGAAKVLLGYLAGVAGEPAEDEVLPALLTLVRRVGPDAALLAALEDRTPAFRSVAALAVGRFGTRGQRAQVRRLLNDPDPLVRLRAAQGLVAAGGPEGVPVLVALLTTAPPEVGRQAEDLLRCLAGAEAPAAALPADGPGRRQCQTAWEEWWKTRGGQIDLKRTGVELVELNPMRRARRVALQFLNALIAGDRAIVRQTADLPFVVVAMEHFTTMEQLEKYTVELHERSRERHLTCKEAGAITGEEFVRLDVTTPMIRGTARFFEPLRWRQVRVVYARVLSDGGGPHGAGVYVVVRVAGGRARVLGVGPGDPPPSSRPGNPARASRQSMRVKRQTGT